MAVFHIPPQYQGAISRAQQDAPIGVVNLARELGLKVYSQALGAASGKLHHDPSASSGWAITVNSNEGEARQRFTIAHELGHFILHRDLVGDQVQDDTFYRSSLSNHLEWQANSFAADLLMPWALIDRLTNEGIDSPHALAKRLNVSDVAMSIRLGIPT